MLIVDNPPFVFYFRVKFYVSEPSKLREEYTRYPCRLSRYFGIFCVWYVVICFVMWYRTNTSRLNADCAGKWLLSGCLCFSCVPVRNVTWKCKDVVCQNLVKWMLVVSNVNVLNWSDFGTSVRALSCMVSYSFWCFGGGQVSCCSQFHMRMYMITQKTGALVTLSQKYATSLSITLPNADRLLEFFYHKTRQWNANMKSSLMIPPLLLPW